MKFSAKQIAEIVEGTIEGNPDATISSLSKIENGLPGTLTFLANPKYTPFIYTTNASVAIVADQFIPEKALPKTLTLVRVKDAYGSFAKLLQAYHAFRMPAPGIHPDARLDASAHVGKNVYVGAYSVIGAEVHIGDDVKIYPGSFIGDGTKIGDRTLVFSGVRIYADCVIGSDCTLHSGVVIGGDGFGFNPNASNDYGKIPQTGNVIIEDYVEIGANTTIDRATLGSTLIRKGVKLDNLIQIAHNVEIGENTVIAAQTGVAGSTKIGKNCMIGGQVGIIGHLTIADETKIAAQSGIGNDIKISGTIVQGSPAFSIMDYKKSYICYKKLPDLMTQINQLKQEIELLKKR